MRDLPIDAEQQAVRQRSGHNLAGQLIVERPVVQLFARRIGVAAIDGRRRRKRIERRPAGIDDPQIALHILIATRRPQRPAAAEIMVEDIGQRRLFAAEEIARLAAVEFRRDLARRVVDQGAERGEDAVIAVIGIVRIGAKQREARPAVCACGHRSGDRLALALALTLRLLVVGAVRAAIDAPQHVVPRAPADIGVDAVQVVGAIGAADRTIGCAIKRQLADLCDQTARARLAIEHRGRALDNLDPIEPRHVDLRHRIAGRAAELAQPVEIDRCVEPAQLELVVHFRRCATRLGGHARNEAQRLIEVLQSQPGNVSGGDHADRLRRLDDRRRAFRPRRRDRRRLLAGHDDHAMILRLGRVGFVRACCRCHRCVGGRVLRGGRGPGRCCGQRGRENGAGEQQAGEATIGHEKPLSGSLLLSRLICNSVATDSQTAFSVAWKSGSPFASERWS